MTQSFPGYGERGKLRGINPEDRIKGSEHEKLIFYINVFDGIPDYWI